MRGLGTLVAAAVLAAPATVRADVDFQLGEHRYRLAQVERTGSMPWGVTLSADGAQLYVTHVGYRDHDNVWRLRAADLQRAAASRFPGHAVESILARGAGILWVTNSRVDRLLGLDPATLEVKVRDRTGRVPKDLRLSADERTLWVAEYGAGTLAAIDAATGARRTVAVGRRPRGVALAGGTVYVMNMGSGTVTAVDAATLAVTASIRACAGPRHAVPTADGRLLLVTCYGGAEVAVIDRASHRRVRRVRVGAGPKTIALTPDGRFALTANEKGNSLSVIDLARWTATTTRVPARQPCGLALSPDGSRIYLTARGSHRLLVFEREPATFGGSDR